MNLHTLKPAKGALKNKKRIGRGQGSGKGGTSTKGHNGAKSRSGYKRKLGFEGGQLPLQRRLPKFGFKNNNKKKYKIINIFQLQNLLENKNIAHFNIEVFYNNGLISNKKEKIKILAKGILKSKISVSAHMFSKEAEQCIEQQGGEIIKVL